MGHLTPTSQKNFSVPHILVIICFELTIFAVDTNESCITENRSLNRSAYQSSDNYPAGTDHGFAKFAVDGGKEPRYYTGHTCTHTKEQSSSPWWYVDLGEPLPISSVEIVNRADGWGSRLNGFELFIGNTKPPTGFNSALRCYKAGTARDGQIFNLPCKDVIGRFVMIRVPRGILSLCEVTVFVPCIKTSYFEILAVDAAATINTLLIRQARSQTECALMCVEQRGCEALKYLGENSLCQLLGNDQEQNYYGMSPGGSGLSYKRKP